MIGRLVERLAREVDAADLVEAAEDRITATVDAAGDVACEMATTATAHARVFNGGRVGWAAGQAERGDEVVDAAIRSAAGGEFLECHLPVPSPLPRVATAAPVVSGLGHLEVLSLARALRDRLAGPGRRLEVWAERVVGSVRVSNTRGVTAEYPRTMVGVGAVARGAGGGGHPPFRLHLGEVAPPSLAAIERLADGIGRWLDLPVLAAWPLGPTRVWLAPRAVRTLLWPLLDRLRVDGAPGAGLSLDPRLTLSDDPLAPLRPGSRPICDDGVPTRRLSLVERGLLRQRIVDLAVGARTGKPATGHGLRRGLGAPRAAFSNLRLEPGGDDRAALGRALGTGLLLLDLPWGPTPGRQTGVFRARAPWAFGVRGGEVVGRIPGAVVAGNALDALSGVVAVGRSAEWDGSWAVPDLVVEPLALLEV